MHAMLVFLACLILFVGAVYGILSLYKWRNGGLLPWQDEATSSAKKPGTGGSPPTPK